MGVALISVYWTATQRDGGDDGLVVCNLLFLFRSLLMREILSRNGKYEEAAERRTPHRTAYSDCVTAAASLCLISHSFPLQHFQRIFPEVLKTDLWNMEEQSVAVFVSLRLISHNIISACSACFRFLHN